MRLPNRLMTALPLSAAVLLGPGFVAGCQHRRAADGQAITMNDLTPEARATLQRELSGAKLGELSRKQDEVHGMVYSAEFERGTGEVEIEFGPDGLVHGVEEDIALVDLPQAVRDAVDRELPTARIVEADKLTRAGVVSYEVEASLRLSQWDLTLSPDGTVLKKEMVERGAKND